MKDMYGIECDAMEVFAVIAKGVSSTIPVSEQLVSLN